MDKCVIKGNNELDIGESAINEADLRNDDNDTEDISMTFQGKEHEDGIKQLARQSTRL